MLSLSKQAAIGAASSFDKLKMRLGKAGGKA